MYLNDHLAGSAGGLSLARRLAGNHRETALGRGLGVLTREIERDRESLMSIMQRLGVRRDRVKQTLAIAGEWAGRVKLNGRLVRRSPLSSVLELEMLFLGVQGKAAGWRTLRELFAVHAELELAELDELLRRADDQSERLEAMRVRAVLEALGADHTAE